MKYLAFDTSTETMSIAVQHNDRVSALRGAGGAQASDRLIPDILALLAEVDLRLADLDAIAFGQGPGAFTGLRGACAVAQGLAFGVGKPVLPVGSLLAVAEGARLQGGATRVLAVIDARMNEVYSAGYEYAAGRWHVVQALRVGAAEALTVPAHWLEETEAESKLPWVVAGNAEAAHGERMPAALRAAAQYQVIPDAEVMLSLVPDLLAQGLAVPADQAMPVYVRDKVADTTAERAAIAAAKQARLQVAEADKQPLKGA